MTATKSTVYPPYQAYTSDATSAGDVYKDLANALASEEISPRAIILFDVENKIVVYSKRM